MKSFQFSSALIDDKWVDRVVITVADDGTIAGINGNVEAMASIDESIDGIAIPGIVNAHSHAFQRAFAGLSEFRTGDTDSFWTWRKLMYDFVMQLTPESVYQTAHRLYRELWQSGYTWVCEFQYVHNRADGLPYDDPTCMSAALIQAAHDAGIGICLLPVLYQRAGFQRQELTPAQRRFVLDENAYMQLVQALRTNSHSMESVRIGLAIHSLRAVDIDTIGAVATALRVDDPQAVVHIHVAEQIAEVEECVAETGMRPVEYLLANAPVDEHWCLIHATHIGPREITAIAQCGATVCLCPTTEANLGDGVFPAPEFMIAGGRFAIGGDSHVCTHPWGELRLIEYAQRLIQQRRSILCGPQRSVGRQLCDSVATGGAAAIGVPTGRLSVGNRADLLVLDPGHPALDHAKDDRILDRLVFCDAGNPVCRTMVGGAWRAE